VDCENLYQKAIESIIRLQQWAQENQWRNTLEQAKEELV
jgi:hypothetical protein